MVPDSFISGKQTYSTQYPVDITPLIKTGDYSQQLIARDLPNITEISFMKPAGYVLLLGLLLSQCKPKEDNTLTRFADKPQTPASIKKEHEYLLHEVEKLILLKDSTGRAATKLNELMQHHFKEEEDYVLPPLGLLPSLAKGEIPASGKEVIGLTNKLKAQLNHMTAEHQLIKAYMNEMVEAAVKENHPEVISLEKEISRHATIEQEVFFPAAIVLGEFLKLQTNEKK